ncbi:MAG: 50S ribosomal protein L3 [Planctomycetota bacterium]|jgi:large subunit ribosomal protein L3|nr:50S ribosomal protein L3 [Planctomycetota bacterium]
MTLILGRKRGMTQIFTEEGHAIGVTIVEVGPCIVTDVRTEDRNGYDAIQLGFEDVREKVISKPARGHFKAAGVTAKRFLREERLEVPAAVAVGDEIKVDCFNAGDLVDVIGTTKGRGFAGAIKRHGFSRGNETHGCRNVRRPGAIGACAYPGRVFKGKRMPGHFGNKRHTTKNLSVVRVDAERNLMLIAGAVPGPTGGFVQVQGAKTGMKKG